jgi:hypothetical protein
VLFQQVPEAQDGALVGQALRIRTNADEIAIRWYLVQGLFHLRVGMPEPLFEFATLIDPEGGIFAQPGIRWNPGNNVTVEGFYNYINGNLWGRETMNVISSLDFAEEFTLRLRYQF